MTINKIDSNVTGLTFAEETSAGVLPATPTWYGLEPNDYDSFGGENTLLARRPINDTRKMKKGVITDRDANAGFNQDFTQNNLTRLLQSFFFAAMRQKPSTAPFNGTAVPITSVATSDDSFNAASGLTVFLPSHLVKPSGFAESANNALNKVATVAAGKITVGTNLTDETAPASDAIVEAVGYEFGAGVVALTVSAALATLTITGLVAATGTYTLSASNQPANDDTVTIGSKVYTFKTTLTGAADEVLRGANQAASLANLAAAINGSSGEGTTYGTGTVAHTQVTGAVAGATVVVTAIYPGTSGNLIATTEVGANSSWGGATLASGAGGAGWLELGLIAGEWLFVGGDDVGTRFSTGTNSAGYGRIHTITDTVITLNDTTWTPSAEAAGAKTIRVFFGNVLRDEDVATLITTRYVQLERSLGSDANGVQSEYVPGCVGNELSINNETADKVNVDLGFIGFSTERRSGATGRKTGTRVAALGEAAYNTSSDVYRIRMNVLDPNTLNPTALFGHVDTVNLTINNNVSPTKAIGTLGAFDVTAGNFETGGEISAYFTEVAACEAVEDNSDVALSMILAARNYGTIWDMPLLSLGGGQVEVEPDTAIMIPLEPNGAESTYGHTLLMISFPYLPTVGMPA